MPIDFEKKFSEYLNEYTFENDIDDEKLDEIVPELYLAWLDAPQDWLDGKTPKQYFRVLSAAELIEMLGRYIFSNVTLPGPLLNRIADTKQETYPFLISLLKEYTGEKSDEIKKTVVRLIEEMDLARPYTLYIGVVASSSEQNDYAEACADELKNAGEDLLEDVIAAYETAGSAYAADCFLDILTDMPYDERVYVFALEKFLYSDTQRAFYAVCLGKLGNEKAAPYLEEALKSEEMTYYDYVAIKNALEELGREIDIERDFSGDKDYESLKNMGE
jgi:hypothetical protein